MELGLKGKVALVAAGSRGLGKAVAEALAAEGVSLALCARNAGVLGATAESIEERFGVPVLHCALDVTDSHALKSFVGATIERFGSVDIGIANAGGPPAKRFADTTLEDWRYAFDLNFMSTVNLLRELLPHMQRRKWGRIVTITSIAAKQPIENLVLSNAMRAAVAGLVKSVANEYAADNVLINNVCPGFTSTARLMEVASAQARAEHTAPEEITSRWSRTIPMGRLGRPEEFASVVAFLCSERAGYVTGTSTAIDGGAVKAIF